MNKKIRTIIDLEQEPSLTEVISQLHLFNLCLSDKQISEKSRKTSQISSLSSSSYPLFITAPKDNHEDNHCAFHYLHLYMNFSFYLLLLPFRPRFYNGHYKLSKNRFQQLFCFITWSLVAFRQLINTRTAWQSHGEYPTIYYFYLAHAYLHSFLTFLLSWIFCSRFNDLQSLLERISHSCLFVESAFKLNKTWIAVVSLHVLFSAMGFIAPVVGYSVTDSWAWTPSWLFRSYVSRARFAFFVDTNISNVNIRPELSNITSWDVYLASFYIIILGFSELQMYLMSLLFGICMLTLWTATDAFKRLIQSLENHNIFKNDRKLTQQLVILLYYEIKDVSKIMNENWGIFCLFYIIDIMPYLATDLDFGLRAADWFDALKMFRSVLFFAFNMILSGETYRNAQWFVSWLLHRNNRNLFTNNKNEMKLILHELKTEPIGFGVNGFYQANYGFAAHVCTIIITFFIITLQYSDRGKRSNTTVN